MVKNGNDDHEKNWSYSFKSDFAKTSTSNLYYVVNSILNGEHLRKVSPNELKFCRFVALPELKISSIKLLS